jgi:hypothetical protein
MISEMKRTVRKTGTGGDEDEEDMEERQQQPPPQQISGMKWQPSFLQGGGDASSSTSSSSSSILNYANYAASNIAATVSFATAPITGSSNIVGSSSTTSNGSGVGGGGSSTDYDYVLPPANKAKLNLNHHHQPTHQQSFRSNGSGGMEPISSFDSQDWQHTVELLQHSDSERSLVNHHVPGGGMNDEHDYGDGHQQSGGGGMNFNQRMKESRKLSSSSRASMERGPQTKNMRVQQQTINNNNATTAALMTNEMAAPTTFSTTPPTLQHNSFAPCTSPLAPETLGHVNE